MAPTKTITWTERAESQLAGIIEFIAADNFEAALALRDRAIDATGRLTNFPDSGRRVPELAKSAAVHRTYREIIVPPLRIVYRRDGTDSLSLVYVLRSEQRFDTTKLG